MKNEINSKLLDYADDGNLAEVKRCIEEGADVNAKDNDGSTALWWASQRGHLEIAEYLKSKSATE